MDKLVTIATYDRSSLANLAKSTLESEGIQCCLQDDNIVAMNWLWSNAVGGIKLQVNARDEVVARRLLETVEPPRLDSSDVVFLCEDCGASLRFPGQRRGGVETCNNCGAYVDVPD